MCGKFEENLSVPFEDIEEKPKMNVKTHTSCGGINKHSLRVVGGERWEGIISAII